MNPPLPTGDGIPPELLGRLFGSVALSEPLDGKSVIIAVARSWKAEPLPPVEPMGPLAVRLVAVWGPNEPTGDGRPSVQVFRSQIESEIDAAQWIACFCEGMSYGLIQQELLTDAASDAMVSFDVEGTAFVGRLSCRIYGAEIVATLASDVSALYSQMADYLAFLSRATAVQGARPSLRVGSRRRVEPSSDWHLEIPASWQVQPQLGPGDGRFAVDFLRRDSEDGLVARIRLKKLSKGSEPHDEITKAIKEWQSGGLSVGAEEADADLPDLGSETEALAYRAYQASTLGGEASLELGVMVFEKHGERFILGSLSPDFNEDAFEYCVAVRTAAILVTTLNTT